MFYKVAHFLVYALARLFFRLRVVGSENVPKEGGVIVAANHNSYFDIPLLGCSLVRRADNIAKSELFKNRLIAALFTALGGFPVRRGQFDRSAIFEAVKRLRAGRLLAIYPEGRRSPDGRLQSAMPGIGLLVLKSGAKVVPAYIQGAHPVRLFRRVTVVFGKPLDFRGEIDLLEKEGVIPKILYARIASKIMTNLEQLRRGLLSPVGE